MWPALLRSTGVGESGVQDAVVERLFSAYFERGEDIGDREVLAKIAGESGMNGDSRENTMHPCSSVCIIVRRSPSR